MSNDNLSNALRQRQRNNLAKNIRAMKPENTTRKPCFVCNRWQSITHCHHITEVSKIAELCLNYNLSHEFVTVYFIWLCPNHHEWWHRIKDKGVLGNTNGSDRGFELMQDISREELGQMHKLWRAEEQLMEALEYRFSVIKDMNLLEAYEYIMGNPVRIDSLE